MVDLEYNIEGFRPMVHAPLVQPLKGGNKRKLPYLEEAIYLDTETSRITNADTNASVGWIYQWAFHFAGYDCIGRYPAELVEDLKRAVQPSLAACDGNAKCIVFVHNLSYDIQYLKQWLIDEYGVDFGMLAVGQHKFITFSIGPFEFRCTWKLSNKSLDKWGKDLGIKHQKKKGLIDYTKVRYQDEPLTMDDWLYMLYDVWALRDCVKKQMKAYGDDLAHIPLTSTGYIRRDARNKYREDLTHNRHFFLKCRMDVDVYKALIGAAAGGICHGNRIFEDVRVDVDSVYDGPPRSEKISRIKHVDYRSHYPSTMRASDPMYGFPVGKFALYYQWSENRSIDFATIDRITTRNCVLVEILIKDCKIKEGIYMPYLMHYKCFEGRCDDFGEAYWDEKRGHMCPGIDIVDNGRVLQFSGACMLYLTEWDLKWLRKQYDFEAIIKTVWVAPRGACPQFLADTVDDNFIGKTVLKDHVKELEDANAWEGDIIDAKVDLMKSKNGLNGIFGMCMTDPVRPEIKMDEEGMWFTQPKTDELIKDKLDGYDEWRMTEDDDWRRLKEGEEAPEGAETHHVPGYYDSFNNFMTYAIGVYVTALARNELMEAVEAIGYKYVLYVDTDSIFYIDTPTTSGKLEKINEWRRIRAEKIGAYVITPTGKKVQYDVLEEEKENITSFKFLHAKAYSYITDGGTPKEKLHATIAGVSEYSPDFVPATETEEQHGISRVQELKSIDRLKHGMTFKRTGGTTCAYIEGKPALIVINGHVTQVASAAIIMETTKKLSGPIAKEEAWWIWDNTEVIQ